MFATMSFVSHGPTFRLMQVLGLVPFSINKLQVHKSSWMLAFSTFMMCLSVLVSLEIISYERVALFHRKNFNITNILSRVHSALTMITYLSATIETIRKRNAHRSLLQVSTKITQITGDHIPLHMFHILGIQRFSLVFVVYIIPRLALNCIEYSRLADGMQLYYICRHVIAPFIAYMRMAQMMMYVLFFERWVHFINEWSRRRMLANQSTIKDLQIINLLYDLNLETMGLINKMFGSTIWLMVANDTMRLSSTIFEAIFKPTLFKLPTFLKMIGPLADLIGLTMFCHRAAMRVNTISINHFLTSCPNTIFLFIYRWGRHWP